IFVHPDCFPASDATALAPDGPLAEEVFPGAYGWASWYWRHLVVDRRLLAEAEAIARMTSAPARAIGIEDRGVVAAGAFADIAVFDPASYRDRASLEEPNVLAEGMAHVFVNGTPTLLDGRLTGLRGGRVLRRGERSEHRD
ncbi:MAG TPA: amidohydrolase family protein, partial [Acidimicrobiales bacterium]|nr:amidohydrolase family protein [Acidimicrobiales bacterium]